MVCLESVLTHFWLRLAALDDSQSFLKFFGCGKASVALVADRFNGDGSGRVVNGDFLVGHLVKSRGVSLTWLDNDSLNSVFGDVGDLAAACPLK